MAGACLPPYMDKYKSSPEKPNAPQLAWSPSAPSGRCSEGDKGENKKPRKQAMLAPEATIFSTGSWGPVVGNEGSVEKERSARYKNKFQGSF